MTEIIKKFYHKNKTPKEVARVQLVEVTPKQKLFPIRDFLVEIFITQCIFGSVSFFRKWELRLQGGDLGKALFEIVWSTHSILYFSSTHVWFGSNF